MASDPGPRASIRLIIPGSRRISTSSALSGGQTTPSGATKCRVQDQPSYNIEKRSRILRQRVEKLTQVCWIGLDALAGIVASFVRCHRPPPSAGAGALASGTSCQIWFPVGRVRPSITWRTPSYAERLT